MTNTTISIPMIHGRTDRPGFTRRMDKDEINACPLKSWEGPVTIVNNEEELAVALRKLKGQTLLGFDTETRPVYKKGESHPPALLQLATGNEVFIFQLRHLGLPEPVREILSDPGIIKAGVSLNFDIRELQKISPFDEAGFVDLAGMAKKLGIKNHGLRGLAAVLLRIRISKSVQKSNWARNDLSQKQIQYAATDAWIGRELYLTMKKGSGQRLATQQAYAATPGRARTDLDEMNLAD